MITFVLGSRALRRNLGAPVWTLALLALGGVLSGCHKGSVTGSSSNLQQGSLALQPGQAVNGNLAFMVEPNEGGRATSVHLEGIRWGRLADIRDLTGVLRHKDFVIDENIVTGNNYRVETNPVSEKTTVTILATYSPLPTSQYVTLLAALEADLVLLDDKSLDPSELPPFPLVPRNAALVLQFDDLIDPNSISSDTVRVLKGYPPTSPFDARIVPDKNHGDLADFGGGNSFFSTRILVDTTVSSIEAAETNPPLPVNALGFPASLTQGQPNIAVRIPTLKDTDIGQTTILRNPTNHSLASSNNGSIDFNTSTRDLVRALRSGGGASTVGDVNNGFLLDDQAPSVLGTQAATVTNAAPGPTPETFVCDLDFAIPTCANRLVAGDVIQQGGVFGEVICNPTLNCAAGSFVTGDIVANSGTGFLSIVQTVYFRIIATDVSGASTIEAGPVQVSMRFHANVPAGKEACFVRFPTITLPPDKGVSPTTSMIVRFTEPMDPSNLKPFDTMMIMRKDPALNPTPTAYDFVIGSVSASADLREFTVTPSLPLTHIPAAAPDNGPAAGETYWLRLLGGVTGPTDLPGNPLATALPAVKFNLDPAAFKQNTNGFALRFSSNDEISGVGGDATTVGVGKRELRGQFLIDTTAQVLRSRPVTHFRAAADRTQPVPSIMAPFAAGLQTPLSKLGSKLQTIWRYCDVGFALLDEANYNVDVEGVSWSPVNGSVISDNFTRFEMSMCHSLHLPDETLDPNLLPNFPNSGLVATYAQNLLSSAADPLRKVYPITGGPTGYSFDNSQLFQGPTGTKFVPWPMNRNVPTKQFVFYTWRDTAVLAKGAPSDSPGAELPIVFQVSGITPATPGVPYAQNQVPTVGLPLLLEFRCYPDDGALGLNPFDVSVATASSSRPNFRAFSTGGVNTSNLIVRKDPDLQSVATGGFNPTSTPSPGAATIPVDNTFYIGNLDLVTRISRVYSIWFLADATSAAITYSAPVVEPRPTDQPEGTQVNLDFRGATAVTNVPLTTDALTLDAYGNRLTTTPGADPTFFNGDATWKNNITSLNTARYFQVRITFIANAETNLNPELSALGFTYRK